MGKKWHWYVGFFVLLFAGYFLYFFSQDDFSQSSLPVINNNVQPFSFTNQNGKVITERDVDGKVYVAEFFFTTCKGICPKMNANMRRVYDAYKNDSHFMILSHTCMPETDSVPLLKKYEQQMLNGSLVQNEDGSYKSFVHNVAKDFLPASRTNLGLDLKGGLSLTLNVEINNAVKESISRAISRAK